MKGIPDDFLGSSRPTRPARVADAKSLGLSSHFDLPIFSTPGAKALSSEDNGAPIDLMSKFLLAVTSSRMKEALALSEEILQFEPNNRIVLEYQSCLREYIAQGLDGADAKENDENDGDDDEGEDDENEEDNDDEDGDSDEENDEDSHSSEDEEKREKDVQVLEKGRRQL